MPTKVQKWGNSLAVRLPREMAKKFKFGEGTTVEIKSEDINKGKSFKEIVGEFKKASKENLLSE